MSRDSAWTDAMRFAFAHEVPWPRDPAAAPAPGQQPFGVHHADPPPYDRLRGPLRPRGGVAGVALQNGREVARWGEVDRADQTFSVAMAGAGGRSARARRWQADRRVQPPSPSAPISVTWGSKS